MVVVPFRRLFVGPRFPFARRGYLVLAALPLIVLVLPGLLWVHRLVLIAGAELFLAISLLTFVGLGRLFGAFDDEEREVGR